MLVNAAATALVGLVVLLAGLVPPYVMLTGQLDPRGWAWPALAGWFALLAFLRWRGALGGASALSSLVALAGPPVLLSATGGVPGLSVWEKLGAGEVPAAARRVEIGILSGPVLHGPRPGGRLPTFFDGPLWQALSRRFTLVPVDALDRRGLSRFRTLLLIQPRALGPDELVALDDWVKVGGHGVILADPDLRWADARPLGHPQRPPRASALGPLFAHWGVALSPMMSQRPGEPVERRILDDGRMIQIAGASHFLPNGAACRMEARGLVARCRIGRGTAILVADADFANDALWTAAPARPLAMRRWTGDAVPFLADLLVPGAGEAMGRRLWLARADGLAAAVRPALAGLVLLAIMTGLSTGLGRTKRERGRAFPT